MKRDFDLVRQLLFYFEEKDHPGAQEDVPAVEGYDESTIKYHLFLLYDAGLLRCEPLSSSTSDRVIDVLPFDLTWEGHEFLEKIRDESRWKRICEAIAGRGGAFAYGVINQVATKLALQAVLEG